MYNYDFTFFIYTVNYILWSTEDYYSLPCQCLYNYDIVTLLLWPCGHVRSIIILLKVLSPIKQAINTNKKYNYKIIITMQNDTKEKMWL